MALTSQLVGATTGDDRGMEIGLLPTVGVSTALALTVMSAEYRRKRENIQQARKRARHRRLGAPLLESNMSLVRATFDQALPEIQALSMEILSTQARPELKLVDMDHWMMTSAVKEEELAEVKEFIKNRQQEFDHRLFQKLSSFDSMLNFVGKVPTNEAQVSIADIRSMRSLSELLDAKSVNELIRKALEGTRQDPLSPKPAIEPKQAAFYERILGSRLFSEAAKEIQDVTTPLREAHDMLATLTYAKAQVRVQLEALSETASATDREVLQQTINEHTRNIQDLGARIANLETRLTTSTKMASFAALREMAREEGLTTDKVVMRRTPEGLVRIQGIQYGDIKMHHLVKYGLVGTGKQAGKILQFSTDPRRSPFLGVRVTANLEADPDMHRFVTAPETNAIDFSKPENIRLNKLRAMSEVSTIVHKFVAEYNRSYDILGKDNVTDRFLMFRELLPKMQHVSRIQRVLKSMLDKPDALDAVKLAKAERLFSRLAQTDIRKHLSTFETAITNILEFAGQQPQGQGVTLTPGWDSKNAHMFFDVAMKEDPARKVRLHIPLVFNNAFLGGDRGSLVITQTGDISGGSPHVQRFGETAMDTPTRALQSIQKSIKDLVAGEKDVKSIERKHHNSMTKDARNVHMIGPSPLQNFNATFTWMAGFGETNKNSAMIERMARRKGVLASRLTRQILHLQRTLMEQYPATTADDEMLSRIRKFGEELKSKGFSTFERVLYRTSVDVNIPGMSQTAHHQFQQETLNQLLSALERAQKKLPQAGPEGVRRLQKMNEQLGTKTVFSVRNGETVSIPVDHNVGPTGAARSKVMLDNGNPFGEHIRAPEKTLGPGRRVSMTERKMGLSFFPTRPDRVAEAIGVARTPGWVLFTASETFEDMGEHLINDQFVHENGIVDTHIGTFKAQLTTTGELLAKNATSNVEYIPIKDENGRGKKIAGAFEIRVNGDKAGFINLDGGKRLHVQDGDRVRLSHDRKGTTVLTAHIERRNFNETSMKVAFRHAGVGRGLVTKQHDINEHIRGSVETTFGATRDEVMAALSHRMMDQTVMIASHKPLERNLTQHTFYNITNTIQTLARDAAIDELRAADPEFAALEKQGYVSTAEQMKVIERAQGKISTKILGAYQRLGIAMKYQAGKAGGIDDKTNLAEYVRVSFNNKQSHRSVEALLHTLVDFKDPTSVANFMERYGADLITEHFMTGTGKYMEEGADRAGNVAFRDLAGYVGAQRWYANTTLVNFAELGLHDDDSIFKWVGSKWGKEGIKHIRLNMVLQNVHEHKEHHRRPGGRYRRSYLETKGGMPVNMDMIMYMGMGGQTRLASYFTHKMRGKNDALDKRFWFVHQYKGTKTEGQMLQEVKMRMGSRRFDPFRVTTKHTLDAQKHELSFKSLLDEIVGAQRFQSHPDGSPDIAANEQGRSLLTSFRQKLQDRKLSITDEEAAAYFSTTKTLSRIDDSVLTMQEFGRYQKLLQKYQMLRLADRELISSRLTERLADAEKRHDPTRIEREAVGPDGLSKNRMKYLALPRAEAMEEGVTHRKFRNRGKRYVVLNQEHKAILKILLKASVAKNKEEHEQLRMMIEDYYQDAMVVETRARRNGVLKMKEDGSFSGIAQSNVGFSYLHDKLEIARKEFTKGLPPAGTEEGDNLALAMMSPKDKRHRRRIISADQGRSLSYLLAAPHQADMNLYDVATVIKDNKKTKNGVPGYQQVTKKEFNTSLYERSNLSDFQLEHNTRAITASKFRGILDRYMGNSMEVVGDKLASIKGDKTGSEAVKNHFFDEHFSVIDGVMKTASKERSELFKKGIFEAIDMHVKIKHGAHTLSDKDLKDLKDKLRVAKGKIREDIIDLFSRRDRRLLVMGNRFPVIGFGGMKPMALQIIDDSLMDSRTKDELERFIAQDVYTAKEAGADFDGDSLYSMILFRKTHAEEAHKEMLRRNVLVRKKHVFSFEHGPGQLELHTVDSFLSGTSAMRSLEFATDRTIKDLGDAIHLREAVRNNQVRAELVCKELNLRPGGTTEADFRQAVENFVDKKASEIKHMPIKSGYGSKAQYLVRQEISDKGELIKNLSRYGLSPEQATKDANELYDSLAKKVAESEYGKNAHSISWLGYGSVNDNEKEIQQQTGKFIRTTRLHHHVENVAHITDHFETGFEFLQRAGSKETRFKWALDRRTTATEAIENNDLLMQKILQSEDGKYLSKEGKFLDEFRKSAKEKARAEGLSLGEAYRLKLLEYKSTSNNKYMKGARVLQAFDKYLENQNLAGSGLEQHIGVKQLTGVMDMWQKAFQNAHGTVMRAMQNRGLSYGYEMTTKLGEYLEQVQQSAISQKHGLPPIASGIIDKFRDLSLVRRFGETNDQVLARAHGAFEALWEGKGLETHLSEFEKRYGGEYFQHKSGKFTGKITVESKIEGYQKMNRDIDEFISNFNSKEEKVQKRALRQINSSIKALGRAADTRGVSKPFIALTLQDALLKGETSAELISRLTKERERNALMIDGYAEMQKKSAMKNVLGLDTNENINQTRKMKYFISMIETQTRRDQTGTLTQSLIKRLAGSGALRDSTGKQAGVASAIDAIGRPGYGISEDYLALLMRVSNKTHDPDFLHRTQALYDDLMKGSTRGAPAPRPGWTVDVLPSVTGRRITAMSAGDHIYEALGRKLRASSSAAKERATGRSAVMLFAAGLVGTSALMPSNLAGDPSGLGGEYFSPYETKNEKKAAMRQQEWLSRRMTSGTQHIRIEDNRFRNLKHVTRRETFNDMLGASQQASVNVYGPTPGMFRGS